MHQHPVADLGKSPAPPPHILVKKEEITEGRKADWASKIELGFPLSTKSGSVTGINS